MESTPPVVVRGPRDDEHHAIADLVRQLGYESDVATIGERIAQVRTGGGTVLVADLADDVVGFATMHVLSVINRPRDVAWLTALVVDENHRGLGIGRALVNAVEAYARQLGCERLSVTTHEDRTGARAFYPSIGMAPTGRRFGKDLR